MPSCRSQPNGHTHFPPRDVGLGILLAAVVLLCGCPANEPAPPSGASIEPFRGQEVELVVPASLPLKAVWEVALHEWMDQTGAAVRWSEYDDDDAESLGKLLGQPAASGGRLVWFPLRKLSEVDQYLAPIEAMPGLDVKDVFKGLRERIVSRNRMPVAIPVSAPVLLCYYRADLLRAAGLNPPQTWDEYQSLLESLDKWAPGLTAVEPLAPGDRSTLFFARSLALARHPENYSVWFDLESGRPLVNSPGFQEAFEAAGRAWKAMPPSIAGLTAADCRNLVLAGKAALAIGVEPAAAAKAGPPQRAESIEIGICRLPGSRRVFNPNSNKWDVLPQNSIHAPAICGFDGTALGIVTPPGNARGAAAWHLLATLAGDAFESNWAALPKSPCRESQLSTASTWFDTGLTVEEAGKSVDAVAQMLRDSQLAADLPIPGAADFRRAADQAIGKLLAGDIDPAEAARQLQSDFELIVERFGADTIRADYRRGLGLPPLRQ